MSENELREYFNIFDKCGWKLLKRFANPVDDDAFWDELVNAGEAAVNRYEKTEFAKKIALIVIDEIKDIYDRKQAEAEKGKG